MTHDEQHETSEDTLQPSPTPRPQTVPQRALWITFALGLSVVAIAAICLWSRQSSEPKLPDLGAVPDWTLTTQAGRPMSLADFRGQIWVADMIFTHCTSTCPVMTGKMYLLQQATADQPDLKLVSFDVDPERDTPDTLAAYATRYHADPKRWTFLTGDIHTIYALAKQGFRVPLDSVGGDQAIPIIHSPKFILIDRRGHIRGYYYGGLDESRPLLLHDIARLRSE